MVIYQKAEFLCKKRFGKHWFKSYPSARTQTTETEIHTNTKKQRHFGVLQGSVLGPLLFFTSLMIPLKYQTNLSSFPLYMTQTYFFANKDLKLLEITVNNELSNFIKRNIRPKLIIKAMITPSRNMLTEVAENI